MQIAGAKNAKNANVGHGRARAADVRCHPFLVTVNHLASSQSAVSKQSEGATPRVAPVQELVSKKTRLFIDSFFTAIELCDAGSEHDAHGRLQRRSWYVSPWNAVCLCVWTVFLHLLPCCFSGRSSAHALGI